MTFTLEGAWQFSSGKRNNYEENVNFYWNFVKDTTTKAQGTMAIAVGAKGYFVDVGAKGYFEACEFSFNFDCDPTNREQHGYTG